MEYNLVEILRTNRWIISFYVTLSVLVSAASILEIRLLESLIDTFSTQVAAFNTYLLGLVGVYFVHYISTSLYTYMHEQLKLNCEKQVSGVLIHKLSVLSFLELEKEDNQKLIHQIM